MLAGASESSIHPLAITGFERSRSLATTSNATPEKASRPFASSRDGFVIAEGAAVLVLEESSRALSRNAPIYAEIAGYGATSDAHHLTQPPTDGDGAYRSMRAALRSASLKPKDVGYINAHATSTPLGDIAEARAIQKLMLGEDGVEREDDVVVSSTKGATGHALGAAGAVEAVFSVLALRDGRVPMTLNLAKEGLDTAMPGFDYVQGDAQDRPGLKVVLVR